MYLDRLIIENFRGISREISLNLQSPLTLLVAANGTCKTTICDAAEWWATGVIERLGGKADGLERLIRHQLEPSRNPSVRAVVRIKPDVRTIERSLSGAHRIIDGSAKRHVFRQGELLGWLCSAGAPQSNGRSALRNLQQWLRGTRFLTGNALTALLDDHEEAAELRKEVFAEILGVGEIQRQERTLATLRSYLPTAKKRDAEVKAAMAAVEAIDRELQRIDADGSRSAEQIAMSQTELVDACAKLLGTASSPAGDNALSAHIVRLEARYGHQHDILAAQLQDLTSVRERYELIPSWDAERKRLQDKIATLTVETSRAKAQRDASTKRVEELMKHKTQAQASLSAKQRSFEICSHFLSRGIDQQRDERRIDLSAYAFAVDLVDASRELRAAVRFLDGVTSSRSKLEQAYDDVDDAKAIIARVVKEAASADEIEAAQRLLADAKGKHAELTAKRESIAGPITTLQLAATQALKALPDHHRTCPACAHDWSDRQTLEQAITAASAALPLALVDTSREISALEERMASLAFRLNAHHKATEDLRKARARLDERNTTIELIWRKAELTSLRPPTKAQVLELEGQVPRDWLNKLEARRLAAHKLLSDLDDYLVWQGNVDTLVDEFARSFPEVHVAGGQRDRLAGVISSLQSMHGALTSDLHKATKHHDDARLFVSEAETVAVAADEHCVRAKEAMERSIREAAALDESRRDIAQRWSNVAGDRALTAENVALVHRDLGQRDEALKRARRLLDQAKALDATSQRSVYRNAAVQRRLAAAAALKRATAHKAYWDDHENTIAKLEASLKTSKQQAVTTQLQSLREVITCIYQRAQANYVFDAIKPTFLKEGAVGWEALLGELSFNPKDHMSQGQRQDLALAIFIARARSLGGTVFLDEPLLHLDDLNRVALLDLFRLLAVEDESDLRMVVTTASDRLAAHLRQKFERVPYRNGVAPLTIYHMRGNARTGVEIAAEQSIGVRDGMH